MANEEKKILMLNFEFPPIGGGGGVASYELAKGFIKNGYTVDFVTSWFKGLQKSEVIDGINVYRVKVLGRKSISTSSITSLIVFPWLGLWQCIKLCRKNKYEFLNTHFVVPTGLLGIIIRKTFRLKNILSLHAGDIYDPTKKLSPHKFWILRKLISFLIRRAYFVVAQSNNTKENVGKFYDVNREIRIIPLPYQEKKFEEVGRNELGLKKNKKYIVGIGRLVKRKGFEYFVQSLKYLDKNIEGIIIGDGPEKVNLKNLATKLKLTNRIHFLGHITEEKKIQYLKASDVYVLSSLHEGLGIVLQEAMQVGLPIVATNNGGQVDIIKDGENGFLVQPKDAKEIAKKVELLLSNNNLARKISLQNKKDLKKYDYEEISKQYLKLSPKSKFIKVLCPTYWYPEFEGDIHATYVHDINRYLVKLGCKISVITPNYNKSMEKESYDDIYIDRFNFPVPFDLSYGKVAQSKPSIFSKTKRVLIMMKYIWQTFHYTKHIGIENQVDIIHAHWAIPSGFPALLAAKYLKKPCIITMHGGDVYYNPEEGYNYPGLWYIKPFLKYTLRNADMLTAITDDCKQHALRAGAPKKNIRIICNGADLERFSPKNNSGVDEVQQKFGLEENKMIFTCRQLIPRKGIRFLIGAMPEILQKFPKTRLLVAGDGMEMDDLKNLIKKLKLTNRVFLLGWVDNKELPKYYNASDIVVMPSLEEGFGIPAAEAMGCAKPVVSTDAGGLVEVVENNITGLIVPKGDSSALASGIMKLLKDEKLAKRMGEAGLKRALLLFDWKVTAKKFTKLYTEILNEQRK